MAISEKAKKITELIYKSYGTGTGYLFGIPPESKPTIEAIVDATLSFSKDIED